jgi:peptidoglycan/LPS O-acetylase OafA/YrhL
MNSLEKIKVLKIIAWTGSIADGLWTIALFWPPFFNMLTSNTIDTSDFSIRLIFWIAASLMGGWTLLLIWTGRNPIERRAVFAFTALVVAGMFAVSVAGYLTSPGRTGWIILKTMMLLTAMIWAYFTANTLHREKTDEIS